MTKEEKIGSIFLFCMVLVAVSAVFMMGTFIGRDWEREDTKKYTCLAKFNRVAQQDISGECLKYFIKK